MSSAAPLFSLEFLRDPYPTYREHRAGATFQPLKIRPDVFATFGYADCLTWFRDPRLTSERTPRFWVNTGCDDLAPFDDLIEHMQSWLLVQGPARHAVLRKLMNRGFTPAVIERLKPQIERIVDELIGGFDQNQPVDLIKDFAYPMPVQVISALLGVPESLRARMVTLSNDIAGWFGNPIKNPKNSSIAQDAVRELVAYFAEIIGRSRRDGAGDNLLTLLLSISAAEEADMSDAELHAQCVMLLFAGHETTRNLIGNAVYSLLLHRAELEHLRREPRLVRGVVEETLRYESPVQFMSRSVTEEIRHLGVTLPVGASLMFMIASAQRDPRQFPDPDRFDIRRKHIRHLSFGGDAHACLGSTLARLEGTTAIGKLVRTFPDVELAETPEWSPNVGLRGLKSLRVNCAG